MRGIVLRSICAAGLFAAFAARLLAQAPETGAVTGRIYNPATQEYVRNAEVKVQGTKIVTTSGDGGYYRLGNIPAGEATLEVNYTGYDTVRESVQITAGGTTPRDIDLVSTGQRTEAGDTVVLSELVISGDREGNAKAIMNQRQNMNVTTSVASDIFGDVTDGNVGEFLKYLPGVDLDYVESETRGPRLGGMDAQYVGVSFDGVKLASADANRTGDLGRATSFEALSISSIEAIEINLTANPSQDADSPAGTIDLKTRRAFDRKGRRIAYNVSLNINSEEFTLDKTFGPSARKERKARPNYSLEYSDVFFDGRLGVVASLNHVDSYTEQYRHNLTFNRTTTTADPRPMVITALNFKDGNKNIEKDTYTLTMDFKATPNLTLSNTIIYNFALGQFFNRNLTFNAATNNTNTARGRQHSLGDLTTVRTDGLATNTQRNATISNGDASKKTHTVTIAPRFEWRLGDWTIDGAATYSRSFNNYDALAEGHVRSSPVNSIASDWIATRSDVDSHEWTVTQVNGADWFNLANYTNPRITDEGRFARTEIYSGMLNARWSAPLSIPTTFRFGAKWTEEGRKNGNETQYYTWSYVGPGGNTVTGTNATTGLPTFSSNGTWAGYENPNLFSTGSTNIITTVNTLGQEATMPMIDGNRIADLFHEHPEYFVNNATPDNYYNAFIASKRDILQTVEAAYGMVELRPTEKLQIQTGVRMENTTNEAREFDPRSTTEMEAAGYAVNSAGRAVTIEGYNYQYFSNPRVTRTKEYDNLFPMISVKYNISESLQFHASANKAISRPPIDSLTGAWLVNDESFLVTSPNPNLLPEYSKNYVARLAYYFEPAGQFTVTVRQNNIRNLRETRVGSAEEFGLGDDPAYADYDFRSPFNVDNPVRFRGLEIGYNQTLTFLPEMFRGTTVNIAYARTYADQRRQRISPHRVSAAVGYTYRRFKARVGMVWHDDTPWDTVVGRYKKHTTKFDVGGEYRINSHVSLFFQGRNIFNDSQRWYESPVIEGVDGALRILENYGANWNFGIKGTF